MYLPTGKAIINISLVCGCLIILFLTFPHSFAPADISPPSLAEHSSPNEIPNIIHYTQLKKTSQSALEFNFESFLSLYAAVLFHSPSAVYIHTDHNASTIASAKASGSKWTQKVLGAFPGIVRINEVTAPSLVNGVEVHVEAKSDFVRWEVLFEHGGVYLDWDVLSLRDIQSLRKSGFNSVVGRQVDGSINPGCVMTRPGSALSQIMRKEGPLLFDGTWETHSVYLINRVGERIAGAPGEILILDRNAMAPTAWYPDSVDDLFKTHDEDGDIAAIMDADQAVDPMVRWETRKSDRGWKMDFSQTYLLHAFEARGHQVPGFDGITVPYILQRRSNYALAAWHAVQHMLEHHVVNEDDIQP